MNSPALPSTALFGGMQAVGNVEIVVREVLDGASGLGLTSLFTVVEATTGAPVEVLTAAVSRMVDSGELTIVDGPADDGESVVTLTS